MVKPVNNRTPALPSLPLSRLGFEASSAPIGCSLLMPQLFPSPLIQQPVVKAARLLPFSSISQLIAAPPTSPLST